MRLSKALVLLSILLGFASVAWAETTGADKPRLLPASVGKFRQVSTASPSASPQNSTTALATEVAEYVGNQGDRASVVIARFRQDAQAYEQLSLTSAAARKTEPGAEIINGPGTAGFATHNEVAFVKGVHFVRIKHLKGNPASLNELAQSLSDLLAKGEGDIPVLIKHLPSPEQAQKTAVFMNGFADLNRLPFQHSVLDAVQSGGDADAVFATYDSGKVLIVEFNTPQLAAENDRRIIARIQELWKLGQPAPTAYRRVGNYSVFVFDAPDEQSAKQLIDQVKYEQVVQWLGENPNILKEAEKHYVNTTLGVLVAVVKASGLALVLCLGMGALLGGLLFNYRRSQQKAVTAFSDAGGMLRLNLDELTAETDPRRLLRERN